MNFNQPWTQEQILRAKRGVIYNAIDMLRTLHGDSFATHDELQVLFEDINHARGVLWNAGYQLELWCYFQGVWMNEISE